jgi:cytochrome c
MSQRPIAALSVLAASALFAPAAANAAGDPVHGAEIYQRCQLCHSIEHDLVGPRHLGLLGRKAGSIPGFPYSDAIRRSGITWSETTLNEFLSGPQAYVPGTRMTFTGLPDAQDRADVIAFLKEATKPK